MPNSCQYSCLPRKMPRYLWANQTATFWYLPEKGLFLVAVPESGNLDYALSRCTYFVLEIKLLWTCPHTGTPSPLFSKNSSYPNTVLSPLSLESQACLGKTTVFCVLIKKQWSRQWRFLFSLNISFISEHKQPLSYSCARCRGGNTCYSWLDYTSVVSSSLLTGASVGCMI